MKSCVMCDLPMIIPYAYCACEGRSYYCSQHVDSSGRCPSCSDYFHYYLISIPWVVHIRRHLWYQPPIFFWTLLWIVVFVKAFLVSYQWILSLTLLEWVICLFGLSASLFIGYTVASGCIHLKRDSDPCPGMGVLVPMAFMTSIALPVTLFQLGAIYYYGILLLQKFPVEGMQPFTVGTCALIITATIVLGIYVCIRSVY